MRSNALLLSGGLGVLSAALFLLTISGGAMFVVYLPMLPVLLAGFGFGFTPALIAAGVAAAVLSLAGNAALVAMFVCFLGLPALIVSFLTMKRVALKDQIRWYPVLRIFSAMASYIAGIVLVVALHYAGEAGGLQGKMVIELKDAYKGVDPILAETMSNILENHTYILVASTAWVWIGMVYLMALLAHLILDSMKRNVRSDFSLKSGVLPTWLLGVLCVISVVSFLADGQIAFVARSLMLIFLLPYFVQGMVNIHARTKHWSGRGFLMSSLYVLMLLTFWPALAAALYGVVIQMRQIGTIRPVSTPHS